MSKRHVHVKAEKVKQQAQAKAEEVTQHVLEGTAAVQAKVAEVSQNAEQLIDQGLDKLPPPVTARTEPLMAALRQRPLLAAAVAVGVLWVLRRLLRKNRSRLELPGVIPDRWPMTMFRLVGSLDADRFPGSDELCYDVLSVISL